MNAKIKIGSQYGVCIFSDGSEFAEWAFFRGECLPVPENTTSGIESSQIANPASVNCLQKGLCPQGMQGGATTCVPQPHRPTKAADGQLLAIS